jgi:cobalamin biosynthesis protein CobC
MALAPPPLLAGFTGHGGRVDIARASFPGIGDWLDLSTGIAPWQYPVPRATAPLGPLPDPAALSELEACAADAFGCARGRVVAVPGSDLALRLLGVILPGPAGAIMPGYAGHRAMWRGDAPRLLRGPDVSAAADELRTIVLARPNNPDGWIAQPQLLEQAAYRLSEGGGHLVVDEAFIEATPDVSLADRDWPGLIVLRSFGKFFGLAGLRLGFVIAPPGIVGQLRGLIGDWPVATPALTTGLAAYADHGWQAAQRSRLSESATRMRALVERADLFVTGQTPFFTLIATPLRDALFNQLARHGILTRPFADQPDWLRIGLPGDEQSWVRLDNVLSEWNMR